MHCSVKFLNGKCVSVLDTVKKSFLPRTTPGCRVFLQSHRKEEEKCYSGALFLSQKKERFWQQRDYCQGHLDSCQVSALTNWTGSPFTVKVRERTEHATQSHFSTSMKSRRELQISLPLPPIQLPPTGCNKHSRDTFTDVSILPLVPYPRKPRYFIVGNTNCCCQLSSRRSSTCVKLTLCNDCYQKCKCKWVSIGMNHAECS